ncbi:MAG: tetratricopeptide repeat protein [Chloroflexi bacterium]|nr:tetratricopeptide repeat protein [Chloroflexota bacterium]
MQTIHFSTRKVESLLAYLALHLESHAREKLAALLWGDSTDELARRSLRTALSSLRQSLGDEIVLADRETVQLNPDISIWVDALAFRQSASDESQSVIDLYQGDLLADLYDDWILQERERIRTIYVDALLQLAQDARSRSEYPRAIEFAQRVLASDPANEKAYQHIIFCLAATGDRIGALKQFDECAKKLRDELGVEPSQETIALRNRIEQDLFESKSREALLTNLPHPLTSFIGREKEIAEVKRLLAQHRLVTLTGSGGCGKTRLAIEVASQLVESFRQGVWWVDLAPLSDLAHVPQAIAQSLGVREAVDQSLEDTLVHFLQTKHLLLVLDNCEHLIAACAQISDKLLRACAELKILATSREALGIPGEVVWHVPSLTLPGALHLLTVEQLTQFDAVRLFAERARTIATRWKLSDHVLAVAHICRRLDGIPLAIELAAARLKVLSVEEIAMRLDDRFNLLTTGSRTALPRQQTLRATIDWSYDLLSDAERVLLQRLSVFAGGWTLEAAESICSDQSTVNGKQVLSTTVLDLIDHLVDKSLVVMDDTDAAARYRMLETIRQYGHEKLLEAGEAEMIHQCHLEWLVHFAKEADSKLRGAEMNLWAERLDADLDNIRAALDWGFEHGQVVDSTELNAALWYYFFLRSNYREAKQWAEKAERLTRDASREICAEALFALGFTLYILGEHEKAELVLQQALSRYRALGNDWRVAFVLNCLGHIAHCRTDIDQAEQYYKEALTIRREIGDTWGITQTLQNFGGIEERKGNYAGAKAIYEEGLKLSEELGDERMIARRLTDLGGIAYAQGDLKRADALLCRAVSALWHMGEKFSLFQALTRYVQLMVAEGQPYSAAQVLGAMEFAHDELGMHVPGAERRILGQTIEQIRDLLGADGLVRALGEGRAMTLEQVITYALEKDIA